MADNKDKKVLKSSIEREQNQTCLNSAEREKIKGSTNLNVPHLRFPEFRGEWDIYEIGDVLCIGNGRDYKHLSKGDIPVFGTGGYMTSVNECLHEGETTFIGRKGTINKPFYYNGKFWTVDTLFYTHSFKYVIPKFVYCLFQTINWLRYNEASGVPSLSKDTIEKIKVRIPQLDEQKKIAKFLSLLDERIATQNKIIEDLKLLKSAIAETVFNNMKGHLTNLSAICSIVKGKQVNGEELSEKGKYYVMNGGITPSGYYDQCNTPANTISISEGGNSCGYVQYNKSSFWSGGHCYTLQDISSGVETQYLFHYLKRYESNIMKLRIGTGLPNIQKKDLENFRIVLPPSNVQKEIATCLTAIEHKILVEINWLDSVQKEKQHLLHQMFI